MTMPMVWEVSIRVPVEVDEVIAAQLSSLLSVMVVTETPLEQTFSTLKFYVADKLVQEETDIQICLLMAAQNLTFTPQEIQWTWLGEQNWAEAWKQHIKPIYVGNRFFILPSWLEPPEGVARLTIRMDPEMAFGSGSHETTQGCLEALEYVAAQSGLDRVLDMGCGSGILSIGAVLLGSQHLLATDVDAEALTICGKNCQANGVFEHVQRLATSDVPNGPFSTIVANILAGTLIAKAEGLCQNLSPDGYLILSGILAEQQEEVLRAFRRYALQHLDTRLRGEWVTVIFKKR